VARLSSAKAATAVRIRSGPLKSSFIDDFFYFNNKMFILQKLLERFPVRLFPDFNLKKTLFIGSASQKQRILQGPLKKNARKY